jgi:hypothetical protein
MTAHKCRFHHDSCVSREGLPGPKSRGPLKDKFYEGELCKQEPEHKLLPIVEKYDVVVVEAKGDWGSWQ